MSTFLKVTKTRKVTRLAYLRELKGYSQKELAEAVGVSNTTIQNYEYLKSNIEKIDNAIVSKLADILGCTVEDILHSQELIEV